MQRPIANGESALKTVVSGKNDGVFMAQSDEIGRVLVQNDSVLWCFACNLFDYNGLDNHRHWKLHYYRQA